MNRRQILVEQLYHRGQITKEERDAAGMLRNLHMLLQPKSEGVSSYGQSPGGNGRPHRKADRKAKSLTGNEIHEDGTVTLGSRPNRDALSRYEDAIFAMAGVTTEEGERVVDRAVVDLMLRAVTDTGEPVNQLQIGHARSVHKSEKQASAVGASFVHEFCKRLALHFRLTKG